MVEDRHVTAWWASTIGTHSWMDEHCRHPKFNGRALPTSPVWWRVLSRPRLWWAITVNTSSLTVPTQYTLLAWLCEHSTNPSWTAPTHTLLKLTRKHCTHHSLMGEHLYYGYPQLKGGALSRSLVCWVSTIDIPIGTSEHYRHPQLDCCWEFEGIQNWVRSDWIDRLF